MASNCALKTSRHIFEFVELQKGFYIFVLYFVGALYGFILVYYFNKNSTLEIV